MKSFSKVTFKNRKGEKLSGRLELPADRDPHHFAIFAHCFTCSKNLNVAVHIARELTRAGLGVLRFDFTGLGESEGDFSDTNFSGNVEDLLEAARFLEENYKAPSLLVGHSLGGSAVILAAAQLPSVKAVATIGAPSEPSHVRRLLKDSEEEILKNGYATVTLERRDFTIRKQFLDDLEKNSLSSTVSSFGKALLILHAPDDRTVDISNAEEIYRNARYPKSFVALDGAGHLLNGKKDAAYAGGVIAQWVTRYLDIPEEKKLAGSAKAIVSLNDADGYSAKMKLGPHYLQVDEPVEVGGKGYAPNPYDYLSGALAACKAMTVQMYARHKGWKVDNITVHINHSKDYVADCENCEHDRSARIDVFDCVVDLTDDLTPEQNARLLEIADRCPVHRTLTGDVKIQSRLSDRA